MNPSQNYNIIFSEILNSYSSCLHSSFGQIFIKHLSYLELGGIDAQYQIFLNESTSRGIPTYKMREKQILSEGMWTQKDENELASYENMISNMRSNYSKDFLDSRRKQLKKSIQDNLLELDKLTIKKNHYIGQTAESYANKKMTYYRISNSFFKDIGCSVKLIEEDIEDKDYNELVELYNKTQDRLGGDNIKKIALSPFFMQIFSLCSDNAYNFYGKPVVSLTNYQVTLWILGNNFKHILSQYGNTLSEEIKGNPEELLETIEMRSNAKEAGILNDDDEKGGSMSIVGAQKSDYAKLGIQLSSNNKMSEALKKSGGVLTASQLLDLEN